MLQRKQVFRRLLVSFPRLDNKMFGLCKVGLKVKGGFVNPEMVRKSRG